MTKLLLLASLLTAPAIDGFLSDKVDRLDKRLDSIVKIDISEQHSKEEQKVQEAPNSSSNHDVYINTLVDLLAQYNSILNRTNFDDSLPYQRNRYIASDGHAVLVNDALLPRILKIKKLLGMNTELDTRYTPETLYKLVEQDHITQFIDTFYPVTKLENKVYDWLGDIFFERGNLRGAAWAYSKAIQVGKHEIMPESLPENLSENINNKLVTCFKLLGWHSRIPSTEANLTAIQTQPINKKWQRLQQHFLKSKFKINTSNYSSYAFSRLGTLSVEQTWYSLLSKRLMSEKYSFTSETTWFYPNNSLIEGDHIFVPGIATNQTVTLWVIDTKKKKVVAQENIASLNSVFNNITPIVMAGLKEGQLHIFVEDMIYVIDTFSLEVVGQRKVSDQDIVKFLKPHYHMQRINDYNYFLENRRLFEFTAQLSNQIPLGKDNVDTPNYIMNVDSALLYDASVFDPFLLGSTFLDAWRAYQYHSLDNPLIQDLFKKAAESDTVVAVRALHILRNTPSEPIEDLIKRNFFLSHDPQMRLRAYLSTALGRLLKPDQITASEGELASILFKQGLQSKNQAIRKMALESIESYNVGAPIVERYFDEFLELIRHEPSDSLLSKLIGLTIYVKSENIQASLATFYDLLTSSSDSVKASLIYALGNNGWQLTPEIETLILDRLIELTKNTEQPMSGRTQSITSATLYALRVTDSLDFSRRIATLIQLASKTESDEPILDSKYSYYDALVNLYKIVRNPNQKNDIKQFFFNLLSTYFSQHSGEKLTNASGTVYLLFDFLHASGLGFDEVRFILFQALQHPAFRLLAQRAFYAKFTSLTDDQKHSILTSDEIEILMQAQTESFDNSFDLLIRYNFSKEYIDFLMKKIKDPENSQHFNNNLFDLLYLESILSAGRLNNKENGNDTGFFYVSTLFGLFQQRISKSNPHNSITISTYEALLKETENIHRLIELSGSNILRPDLVAKENLLLSFFLASPNAGALLESLYVDLKIDEQSYLYRVFTQLRKELQKRRP